MNKHERETVITMSDGDPYVRIWTAQATVRTKLRKRTEVAVEVASTMVDGTECVEFLIPADRYDPARGIRHVLQLTDHERQARCQAQEQPCRLEPQNRPSLLATTRPAAWN